jgi:hypothetical protein
MKNFKLRHRNQKAAKRILIIGAGDCGEKIRRLEDKRKRSLEDQKIRRLKANTEMLEYWD